MLLTPCTVLLYLHGTCPQQQHSADSFQVLSTHRVHSRAAAAWRVKASLELPREAAEMVVVEWTRVGGVE